MPRLLKLSPFPPAAPPVVIDAAETRPGHGFPLIGVWVEREAGRSFENWSTANTPDALASARSWAFNCLRHGDLSCSIRFFHLDGPEHLYEILDWRDLPENEHIHAQEFDV